MIKIGMIIGERYEVLEKIGTGGMSDVYKAKDHKLNRFVAVKVLKQEFSENANFVSKFEVEAQAAAGLMHPNIVNVYDVGEESGIHYIVMELVEGITLKKYIEKKARISVKEAISIAIQVSMGIEAAHNNHIIHRDIKPQNVMISKEGKVKVTDFGIAKAATSNTITSNVMGSVHYTSPEQARGGYSDERSDIYSLGVTLFEMLTGRVPFNGETTVAIAIKHIQEPMPSARDFVSEIPVSVEQIVYKCCQKSPDRRYQSIGELIEDLKKSLTNPDDDFVKIVNPDEEASTRTITDSDMSQIKKQSKQHDRDVSLRLKNDVESEERGRSGKGGKSKESGSLKEKSRQKEETDEFDSEYDPRMEKITTALTVVAAVIIGCIIFFLAGKAMGIFPLGTDVSETTESETSSPVLMPEVEGYLLDDARLALEKADLTPEIKYEASDKYPKDTVIKASIKAGDSVERGQTVVLTVSSGSESESREVPSVTGKTYEEGKSELEKAGFEVIEAPEASEEVESGRIIAQSPEGGTSAPEGSSVTLRVSRGLEDNKVKVPNLLGKEEDEAMALLIEAGLALGNVERVESEQYPADQICYQSYSVDAYVEKGTMIDIRVSVGAAAATYSFNGSIQGPTSEEDPSFKSGTSVQVTIQAADGTILMDMATTSFPFSVNYSGIRSETGKVTFHYTTTAADGTQQQMSFERPLQFTKEN